MTGALASCAFLLLLVFGVLVLSNRTPDRQDG